MKRYAVLHNYCDKWKITAATDTMLDAVRAREAEIAMSGGEEDS